MNASTKISIELWLMHVVNLGWSVVMTCLLLNGSLLQQHPLAIFLALNLLNGIDAGLQVGRNRLPWIVVKGLLVAVGLVVWRNHLTPTVGALMVAMVPVAVLCQLRQLSRLSAHSS